MNWRTTSSIPGCIVALNKTLAIFSLFEHPLRIVSIYSRKPSSNILSASSTTSYSRLSNLNCSSNSANLRGVDIRISQLLTNSSNYSWFFGVSAFLKNLTLAYPSSFLVSPPPLFPNMRNSLYSYMANSLVGATTTALSPSPLLCIWMRGAKKARLFPEPVSAKTIASRRSYIIGIACI